MRQMTSERPPRFRELFATPGGILLLLGLVVFCLVELRLQRMKPLWFDEMSSMITVSEPTLRAMFRAEPIDGNPPLMYVLARMLFYAMGPTQLALRLPALLGVLTALVCTFLAAARRSGAATGLLAATLLVCSPIALYSIEGRPYGLLCGCLALVLVFWQRAAGWAARRRGALIGLTCSVFALILTHPLGVLYAAVPLLAGESVRIYKTRRPDWVLWGCALLGFVAVTISVPVAFASRASIVHYAGSASPPIAMPNRGHLLELAKLFLNTPPVPLVLLLGVVTSVAARSKRAQTEMPEAADRVPLHEWAFALGLASMPLVIWFFTVHATHYFFIRYTFPSCIGLAFLLTMLCERVPGKNLILPVVAVSAFSLYLSQQRTAMKEQRDALPPSRSALLENAPAGMPIVIASALDFPSIWWYSQTEARSRLHFISDVKEALTTPDFIPELCLASQNDKGVLPFAIDHDAEFLQENRSFVLVYRDSYPLGGEWLPARLRQDHYSFEPLAADRDGLKLALVSAPS